MKKKGSGLLELLIKTKITDGNGKSELLSEIKISTDQSKFVTVLNYFQISLPGCSFVAFPLHSVKAV